MASFLLPATNSNGLQPTSDGLQPTSDVLQPRQWTMDPELLHAFTCQTNSTGQLESTQNIPKLEFTQLVVHFL